MASTVQKNRFRGVRESKCGLDLNCAKVAGSSRLPQLTLGLQMIFISTTS